MSEVHGEDGQSRALCDFTDSAQKHGIQIHPSIQPYRFPHHGLGICAIDAINSDTTLIYVPSSALVTPASIPLSFCSISARQSLSAHALLAAYVAFDGAFDPKSGEYASWRATWPSFDDLKGSLALLWSENTHRSSSIKESEDRCGLNQLDNGIPDEKTFHILPPGMSPMLNVQKTRYRHDFESVVSLIAAARKAYHNSPSLANDSFKYAWCIVNTRSLYFDAVTSSNGLQRAERIAAESLNSLAASSSTVHPSNQSMALCPFIDLFNHHSDSNSTCTVIQDAAGFTVTAQKPYHPEIEEREEIFVSYGPHSNDFLLLEYGFLPPSEDNMYDSVQLDSAVLSTMDEPQKARLSAKGYLGNYALFRSTTGEDDGGTVVCWRTEVAARITFMDSRRWGDYVDGLLDDDPPEVDTQITTWIDQICFEASNAIAALESLVRQPEASLTEIFANDGGKNHHDDNVHQDDHNSGKRIANVRRRHHLVLERWRQIHHFCLKYLAPREKGR